MAGQVLHTHLLSYRTYDLYSLGFEIERISNSRVSAGSRATKCPLFSNRGNHFANETYIINVKRGTCSILHSSAITMPTWPHGAAGLLINNDHISAPKPSDRVALEYIAFHYPSSPTTFNCSHFMARIHQMRTIGVGRISQICPRHIPLHLVVLPPSIDSKIMPGGNIAIVSMSGGWTLDLRGVIFITSITQRM